MSSAVVKRTTCPFCLNGCTSGTSFDGYQYRMHYFADADVNKGRLCPRGNAASIVIDHPERACRPLRDGKAITWSEAEQTVRKWLAEVRPEELAIVYSRGRSADEVRKLHSLARVLGTPNLVCGHIEPENAFNARLEGVADATLEQVRTSTATLLVGDVFGTSPVASWRMLEARYADRKSRLVVVDSIKTRQAGFAHEFVRVLPGTEPFALAALAALVDPSAAPEVDVGGFASACGASRAQLASVAKLLGTKAPGFVGCAAHTGRVRHPLLHSLTAQLVAKAGRKPFVGFRETGLTAGLLGFSAFRQAVSDGRIKMVFWTGGLYPYSYAELMPELASVQFRVATAIFNPDPQIPGLVLPVRAELERASEGATYWGTAVRSPLARPLDGTREFGEVLAWFGRAEEVQTPPARTYTTEETLGLMRRATTWTPAARGRFTLLGEKKAVGLRGFFDPEETVQVNPVDAAVLDAGDRGYVRVTTSTGSRQFRVHATDAVPTGCASIGVNVHANRGLFALDLDEVTAEATVPPADATLEKADRIAQQGGENPTVWS